MNPRSTHSEFNAIVQWNFANNTLGYCRLPCAATLFLPYSPREVQLCILDGDLIIRSTRESAGTLSDARYLDNMYVNVRQRVPNWKTTAAAII